jgi:4-hydroxybenzoate polyprenyltransferase
MMSLHKLQEINHFILHLRLHYQFFILSGGYLLGGLLADQMNTTQFWLQFLNVHVLLFGGATAYNSYWDKDEGPIGGLKNPPKMTRWMHPVSLLFMFTGWAWAAVTGWVYFIIFGISLLLFWLYSTPHARWKGNPHLSLFAIAVSTGFNSVLLGFWAAGGSASATTTILFSSLGAALILLSLYPVSQIYQSDEDRKRGDVTFFIRYGVSEVKIFFTGCFLSGLIILTVNFYAVYKIPAVILFTTGLLSFVILQYFISRLRGEQKEYKNVMNIKLFASLSFVLFLLISNAIRYEWIGETFLKNYF